MWWGDQGRGSWGQALCDCGAMWWEGEEETSTVKIGKEIGQLGEKCEGKNIYYQYPLVFITKI